MAGGPGLRLKGSAGRNGYGELSQKIPDPTAVRSHRRPTVNVCQEHYSLGVISLAGDDDTEKEGCHKSREVFPLVPGVIHSFVPNILQSLYREAGEGRRQSPRNF